MLSFKLLFCKMGLFIALLQVTLGKILKLKQCAKAVFLFSSDFRARNIVITRNAEGDVF